MDVSAFSGESFDAKDWINRALRNSDPTQSKEAAASSLVMKLQLMIAKLNTALEEQCNTVVQSIPRVIKEAEQLQQEASLLREKLSAVKADVESVEQETEANMHSLLLMDRVKERLADTSRALQEADNWTSLDNQVEEAFESNDIDLVSEKLAGMQASLRLLHHVVDYQERVEHLETHRNRLEATLSPQLVAAFSSLDRSSAVRLVSIFRRMERGKQLTKYYTKCVRATLLQRWTEIVNTLDGGEGSGSSSGGGGVGVWLEGLYTALTASLRDHRSWCAQVFPDLSAGVVMCDILVDVLSSLDPTLDFCIEAGIKMQPDTLNFLIQLRTKTDRFVGEVRPLVEGASEIKERELARLIHNIYRPYVARYGELENQTLLKEMASWTTGAKDTIEEIHSLVGSVAKLNKAVLSAGDRCVLFTKGVGFLGLAAAVKSILDTHLDRYRKLMRRLDRRRTLVDDDWSVLQHCLAANQATGSLLAQLEELDMALSLLFLDSCRAYFGPDAGEEVMQQHHVLLLEPVAIAELTTLYTQVAGRGSGVVCPVLHSALELLSSACSQLQTTTFNIMFHPVASQLECLPGLEAWQARSVGQGSLDSDMPDFSFAPQEYITQIGEYLMTLPQHLEPYMSGDTSHLARAFREAVFPGSKNVGDCDSPVDFLLGCIAVSTCESYLSALSSIPSLTTNSARQLAVDIGYLGDILEDLGHPLSSELSNTATLLKLPASSFREASVGLPSKLVQTIRTIRGIE